MQQRLMLRPGKKRYSPSHQQF